MCPCITLSIGRALGLAALTLVSQPGAGEENVAYRFESAAAEITQLYWLADTAAVCGWASEDESTRFKSFSVRFLTSHLNARGKDALVSLVSDRRYESGVHQSAVDGASENCTSARWHAGWKTFKAAADENESQY